MLITSKDYLEQIDQDILALLHEEPDGLTAHAVYLRFQAEYPESVVRARLIVLTTYSQVRAHSDASGRLYYSFPSAGD
jgi:hypothetical protein